MPRRARRFSNSYAPAYLEPGYYHADGQIDGEVFEYGSFLQSRMYHAGVTCTDCHEPHSAKLRAEGNTLCARCHMAEKFDTAEHSHHQAGSTGAECINCHMPMKTYMIVDRRRDHSFRVPRPDLTVSIGTPNACTQCHTDRSADWAARTIAAWYPNGRQTQPQYGMALQAGRVAGPDAEQALDRLIVDRNAPAIARGSALLLLRRFISPASAPAIKAAIGNSDALVRAAASRAMPNAPSRAIAQSFAGLLSDPVRAVRIEAARALAGVNPDLMTPEQRTALATAEIELVASETITADRPELHLNLGLFDLRRQLPAEADAEYRTALRLDPTFVPALVNLADLDRTRGMDQQGGELLRKAMAIEPDNPDVQFSLALLLVRQHNYGDALPLLRRAGELAPDNDRYQYVYAIALNSNGETGRAITVLQSAYRRNPSDRDVVIALISIERDNGDLAAALRHGQEWIDRHPSDTQVRILVQSLEGR